MTGRRRGLGDIVVTYHARSLSVEACVRRIKLIDIIRETIDPAELPEYLISEDPFIVEAAKLKLNELTGE